MRIYHRPSGRVAKPRNGAYQCFPPKHNATLTGRSFATIEEAAIFLLKNPNWKIWVAPNPPHADGQVSKGLVIDGQFDRDDLMRRSLLP